MTNDREAWFRFDDADDVDAEAWALIARVRADYLERVEGRSRAEKLREPPTSGALGGVNRNVGDPGEGA